MFSCYAFYDFCYNFYVFGCITFVIVFFSSFFILSLLLLFDSIFVSFPLSSYCNTLLSNMAMVPYLFIPNLTTVSQIGVSFDNCQLPLCFQLFPSKHLSLLTTCLPPLSPSSLDHHLITLINLKVYPLILSWPTYLPHLVNHLHNYHHQI